MKKDNSYTVVGGNYYIYFKNKEDSSCYLVVGDTYYVYFKNQHDVIAFLYCNYYACLGIKFFKIKSVKCVTLSLEDVDPMFQIFNLFTCSLWFVNWDLLLEFDMAKETSGEKKKFWNNCTWILSVRGPCSWSLIKWNNAPILHFSFFGYMHSSYAIYQKII